MPAADAAVAGAVGVVAAAAVAVDDGGGRPWRTDEYWQRPVESATGG